MALEQRSAMALKQRSLDFDYFLMALKQRLGKLGYYVALKWRLVDFGYFLMALKQRLAELEYYVGLKWRLVDLGYFLMALKQRLAELEYYVGLKWRLVDFGYFLMVRILCQHVVVAILNWCIMGNNIWRWLDHALDFVTSNVEIQGIKVF